MPDIKVKGGFMSKPKRVFLIFIIVSFIGWLTIALANNFLEKCSGIKEAVQKEDSNKETIRNLAHKRPSWEI